MNKLMGQCIRQHNTFLCQISTVFIMCAYIFHSFISGLGSSVLSQKIKNMTCAVTTFHLICCAKHPTGQTQNVPTVFKAITVLST